jgi:putative tryptophan/tyrosine transport system substrate-binding protein
MRRRDFLFGFGSAALVIAAAARAQQSNRRIGWLVGLPSTDPVAQRDIAAFEKGLADLGWRSGSNVKIEYRWGPISGGQLQKQIRDLVDLRCEVIVSRSTPVTAELVRTVKTIPIVFVNVSDPVGDGIVASMARPGGNVTGFTNVEATMGSKWVEILKQLAPGISHVTMLYSPKTTPGKGAFFLKPFEASASHLGVRTIATAADSDEEIGRAVDAVVKRPGGALIVAPGVFLVSRRELVLGLAARHRIPAMYPFTFWTDLGGLMSYGSDSHDVTHRAASYVDRVLKGAKPADLPIQAPVKFELVVNLKTAKALGLSISPSFLVRADRVIE